MRYKIEINLQALKELKSRISLEEAVLLDYLYWLCSSVSQEVENMRIEKDGIKYTWFDYGFYIKETPILRGKSKGTITPKIKNLEKEGFIETILQDGQHGGDRKYVRLLPKCDGLFRKLNEVVEKTERDSFRKLNIDNNTSTDNETKDKGGQSKLTPSETMSLLVESVAKNEGEMFEKAIEWAVEKFRVDERTAREEIKRFVLYWTEPSRGGKKVRWEMQATFEVGRRLMTWFRNASKFRGKEDKGRKTFSTI